MFIIDVVRSISISVHVMCLKSAILVEILANVVATLRAT